MKIVKNAALCAAAALTVYSLNSSFSFLVVKVLGLPLFLDTLFTCALAFTIDPLPGITITLMSYGITGTVRYLRFGDRGTYLLCPLRRGGGIVDIRLPPRTRATGKSRRPGGRRFTGRHHVGVAPPVPAYLYDRKPYRGYG
ncbi:MAG: hypothetical protein LBQ38_10620 [Spirochaetaceae bacterium]|nr:hypothetical protein [Spirochaetaceae bacterium]